MARKTTQWFLPLQMILFLFLIFVRGNEDADDAYKNRRNLVLEYFLPINSPTAVDVPFRREKRDVEGSGEDDSVIFSEFEKSSDDADNATEISFAKLISQAIPEKPANNLAVSEGSGEVDEASESSEEEKSDVTVVPLIMETELFTTTQSDGIVETTKIPENRSEVLTEVNLTSTEIVFDKSEDFDEISTVRTEETTTITTEFIPTVILINPTVFNKKDPETTATISLSEEITTEVVEKKLNESTTFTFQEITTVGLQTTTTTTTTTAIEETTTALPAEVTTAIFQKGMMKNFEMTHKVEETTTSSTAVAFIEEKTTASPPKSSTLIPIIVPPKNISEDRAKPMSDRFTTPHWTKEITETSTSVGSVMSSTIPKITENLPVPSKPPITSDPMVEEVIKETKIDKKLEALPGNILQKENLSLAADPLLIANTRLMDSEENVKLSSSEPKRLGAYIVIGLILLSFLSLVGYITFKKRMSRKRQEFESNQESNDTEKALLSLSDYKDNSELEENHLKNNEITPIVVKSNSQINKFEKNTNFSSPKNLNTIANEKNIEKDNVLKSTAENLTQVIIEDSPKDLEEDKKVPSMEKLIVKTRIDQDSIPKKPIIINRSSTGYLPIPQDNS